MSKKILKPANDGMMLSSRGFLIPQNREELVKLYAVDAATRQQMLNTFSITLPYDWMAATIAMVFFENVIKSLVIEINREGLPPSGKVGINLYDIFEVMVTNRKGEGESEKEGNLSIAFVPGVKSKLLTKSDRLTEMEE